MIYSASSKNGYLFAGVYDPDSKRPVGIIYAPVNWVANTVYYHRSDDDYDIVIPTAFTGLYYRVKSAGKSGSTEPTWGFITGGETVDGVTGLEWEAVSYNLMPPTDTIATSTWTATNGVTLSGSAHTNGTTQVFISTVPAGITEFAITNHTIRNTGQEDDVTLRFRVGDR